jgi:hypothetical protein
MPSGALVQLVSIGVENRYLIGNPTTTFFKTIYKKHTNFAIEAIRQSYQGSGDFGTKLTCTLYKDGDLVNNTYIEISLPTLNQTQQGASWVSYTNGIANALVKSVELEIGGRVVDRHYSEWLDIWAELNLDINFKNSYDQMVGNYPSDLSLKYAATSNTGYTLYNVYYTPLRFWFNRNIGNSLPLIALQYHDIKLNIELRSLSELIRSDITLDTTKLITTEGAPVKIADCSIWTDYIYLDKQERTHIANNSHEYLIDQVQFNGAISITGNTSATTISLDYNHPVRAIYWIFENESYLTTNTATGNKLLSYEAVSGGDTFNKFKLQLNGNDRFEERSANYFRLVQQVEHSPSAARKYIYMYSFAINSGDTQPSGTCNFSKITDSLVNFSFDARRQTFNGSIRHKMYAVNYNIFKISNGMGTLEFFD